MEYTFDANGNVLTETQRNGTVVTNTWDDVNRMTDRAIQRATGVLGTAAEHYVYDDLSRLTHAENNDSAIDMEYDSLNNRTRETQNGKVVQFAHDDLGNVLELTYPNSRKIKREFDPLGRITKILDGINSGAPEIASFGFAGRGLRMLSRNYLNGNQVNYGYDTGRRLTEIISKKTSVGDLIENYVYGYNRVGMKMFEKRGHEGNTGEQYAYDPAYRLMQVKKGVPAADIENPNTTNFTKRKEYRLDGVENITKIITEQSGNITETLTEMATANAQKLHQYTTFDQWALAYDLNGNTTQKGTQNFSYDYRNQLVRATEPSKTVTFKYDPFGRRIEKNTGANTEKYYYAGNQVIEVRNGSDQVIKQLIMGNGIDEPVRFDLFSGSTATPYYFHTNQIGSITAITNATGDIVERVKYDDYGLPTFTDAAGVPLAVNQSTIGNTICFQGREWDQEIGMHYFRARTLDNSTGRFLQQDLIEYADSMNLYQALNQNPTNFMDPLGKYFVVPNGDPNRNGILTALAKGAYTPTGSPIFWNIFNDSRQLIINSKNLSNTTKPVQIGNMLALRGGVTCGEVDRNAVLKEGLSISGLTISIDFANISFCGQPTNIMYQGNNYTFLSQNSRNKQNFNFGTVDIEGITTLYHELRHAWTLFETSSPENKTPYYKGFAKAETEEQSIIPNGYYSNHGSAQKFGEMVYQEADARKYFIDSNKLQIIIDLIETKQKIEAAKRTVMNGIQAIYNWLKG